MGKQTTCWQCSSNAAVSKQGREELTAQEPCGLQAYTPFLHSHFSKTWRNSAVAILVR